MKLGMIEQDIEGAGGETDQRVNVVGGVEQDLTSFEGAHIRIGKQARAEFSGLVRKPALAAHGVEGLLFFHGMLSRVTRNQKSAIETFDAIPKLLMAYS